MSVIAVNKPFLNVSSILFYTNQQYSASIYSVDGDDSSMIDGSDFVGEVETEMVSSNEHVVVKITQELQVCIMVQTFE